MLFKKKNKYKPVFKQLIKLRENVQNNPKILKFKNPLLNRKKYKFFKNGWI